ncbi:MAG: efflux RND transporter periplasmic adaptor subunit, partial [Phycisphaerae bacterium]
EATYQQALITLRDAKQRLKETTIYAPIDGQITRINTQVGEVIQGGKTTITGGTVLMVLADISRLYVIAEVDEADIGRVRDLLSDPNGPGPATNPADLPSASGQVTITVDAFQGESFVGMISRIKPEPKKASNVTTYDVQVVLTSPNRRKLMLGMQADVTFTAQSLHNVLLVDNDALRSNALGQVGVYVPVLGPDGEQRPEFRPVKRGLTDGSRTQILAGLEPGQRVYTKLPIRQETSEQE